MALTLLLRSATRLLVVIVVEVLLIVVLFVIVGLVIIPVVEPRVAVLASTPTPTASRVAARGLLMRQIQRLTQDGRKVEALL